MLDDSSENRQEGSIEIPEKFIEVDDREKSGKAQRSEDLTENKSGNSDNIISTENEFNEKYDDKEALKEVVTVEKIIQEVDEEEIIEQVSVNELEAQEDDMAEMIEHISKKRLEINHSNEDVPEMLMAVKEIREDGDLQTIELVSTAENINYKEIKRVQKIWVHEVNKTENIGEKLMCKEKFQKNSRRKNGAIIKKPAARKVTQRDWKKRRKTVTMLWCH